jgi:hypothetical protein
MINFYVCYYQISSFITTKVLIICHHPTYLGEITTWKPHDNPKFLLCNIPFINSLPHSNIWQVVSNNKFAIESQITICCPHNKLSVPRSLSDPLECTVYCRCLEVCSVLTFRISLINCKYTTLKQLKPPALLFLIC